jgi:hypothetical protein
VRVTVRGEPITAHACSCRQCQKSSGSAFSFSAWFADAQIVAIEGEYRSWRRGSAAGRWSESSFCPVCGSPLFGRVEALPGQLGVAASGFDDPAFVPPRKLYWASCRPDWLVLPAWVTLVDEQ